MRVAVSAISRGVWTRRHFWIAGSHHMSVRYCFSVVASTVRPATMNGTGATILDAPDPGAPSHVPFSPTSYQPGTWRMRTVIGSSFAISTGRTSCNMAPGRLSDRTASRKAVRTSLRTASPFVRQSGAATSRASRSMTASAISSESRLAATSPP